MRPLLTKQEMQALDRRAIDDLGIPVLVLMEVAGRAVADRAEALANGRPVLALAGLGNNGGDAIVAARHLKDRGLPVTLLIAGDPTKASADCQKQLAIAAKLDLSAELAAEDTVIPPNTVVIDGLFGTGLTRPIEGLAKKLIDAVNAANADVIAVDIPSGIDADTGQILGTAIRAKETVTFQHAKLGHVLYPGREHTGVLHVADIGIPRALLKDHATFIAGKYRLPKRPADTHKGTYGHLLVVAGVPDRPGSSLLAARAALRTGAGLVTIGSDAETIRRIAPVLDELMGTALIFDAQAIERALETKTALVIGPSLSPDLSTRNVVIDLVNRLRVPAVVDAGALSALGDMIDRIATHAAPLILTPHPGEMAWLVGQDTKKVQADRAGAARALARRVNAIVVLKGASTVIAHPDGRLAVALEGNPGMATGGTGDVLAGIIGGLLAQRVEPFEAAWGGVVLHGQAGDRAARTGEARLIASDLIANLGAGEG